MGTLQNAVLLYGGYGVLMTISTTSQVILNAYQSNQTYCTHFSLLLLVILITVKVFQIFHLHCSDPLHLTAVTLHIPLAWYTIYLAFT